jgi:ferric-dicitrate binding protein FerR (iron transport regulator)
MDDEHLQRDLHIAELLKRSLFDELSATERETLEAWMNQKEAHRRQFDDLDRDALADDLLEAEKYDVRAATMRIFAATGIGEKPEKQPSKIYPLHLSTWWKIAAACLFLATAGLSWYHFSGRDISMNESANARSVVVPGGNKAVLLLSDGQKVELEAASNGLLSQEGDARIIKLEDGKLTYQSDNGSRSGKTVYNTLSTPRGGQYQLTLPDGSNVWLNAASSITFPNQFDGNERRVSITGEAYFEVRSIPGADGKRTMPFIVEAGNERIRVVGTQFNINAYGDEGGILTTLVEGSVIVGHPLDSVTLKPGQQSKMKGSAGYKVSKPDLEEVLAWKNGKFLFNQASTKLLMTQLSRWYDIDIEYQDNVSGIYFSGGLSRKDRLEKMMELLELDGRLKLELEGHVLKVMLNESRKGK